MPVASHRHRPSRRAPAPDGQATSAGADRCDVRHALVRGALDLLSDDRGQDLIEYALLSAFVGLAGLAALEAVSATIGDWYRTSNSSVNELADTPP